MKERIARHLQDHREAIKKYITDLTCRLVRQRTVNFPPGGGSAYPYMDIPGQESRVARIVQEELARHRVEAKLFERTKERANVVASVGRGRRRLLLACHTDVVPPGEGWRGDPFEPVVRDGYIVGRGTLDNKGPLVAGIVAAQVLKSYEKHLKGQFILVGVADGERRGPNGQKPCGIDWLMGESIHRVDFAIVPDVGRDMREIAVAEKGRMILRVATSVRPSRPGSADRPENPLMRTARLVERFGTFRFSHPPHPTLGPATVDIIKLTGEALGRKGGSCQAVLDVRYVPGQSRQGIINELTALATAVGGTFECTVESDDAPVEIDPENLLVRAIQHNVEREMGVEPAVVGVNRVTLARELIRRGVLAVGFGPGSQAAYHAVNEFVEIDQLFTFARILAFVVVDLLT